MTTCSILETGRILEIILSFFSYIVWEVYYVLDLEREQKKQKISSSSLFQVTEVSEVVLSQQPLPASVVALTTQYYNCWYLTRL